MTPDEGAAMRGLEPSIFAPVLTKTDFVQRYKAGVFGNASPTWDTLEEFMKMSQSSAQRFHLRNRLAGGSTHYNLSWVRLINLWSAVRQPGDWYCSAMAPHDKNLIQGEIWDKPGGLYLMYSNVLGKAMRDALAEKTYHVEGTLARCILKRDLCWNSYDWLQVLLERYPGHVVEFSTFSVNWGTVPRYNTVFWEVRGDY